jgi:hypothetical protein
MMIFWTADLPVRWKAFGLIILSPPLATADAVIK